MSEVKELNVNIVNGSFVKEKYMKCPKLCKCKWKINDNHKYEYLKGACYLSGSFELECPDI